jgi:hypothetical protein
MIFVRGNHEDHDWLDDLEAKSDAAIFSVDAYQRVFCLKTGVPYEFSSGGESIKIFGIGRVGPLIGEPEPHQSKLIQLYEKERIYEADFSEIDILLTHDTAMDSVTVGFGMEEIRLVLDAVQPAYHFHGHTEEHVVKRLDKNGQTQSIKLSDLHWDHSTTPAIIEQGAMGVLRWTDSVQHRFEVVDAPWLSEYNANSWENFT